MPKLHPEADSWSWWAWKAFVAGLALIGGARAQNVPCTTQTIFNIPAGQGIYLNGPLSCQLSSLFPVSSNWNVSAVTYGAPPVILEVGANSATLNFNTSEGQPVVVHNGASQYSPPTPALLVDCSVGSAVYSGWSLPSIYALDGVAGQCGNVGEGEEIDCTLFKAPDLSDPGTSQVRMYTKGYKPSIDGFPADATISLSAGQLVSFAYRSNQSSVIEFLPATAQYMSDGTSTVFLSCMQNQTTRRLAEAAP